jgi:hypothetical protein
MVQPVRPPHMLWLPSDCGNATTNLSLSALSSQLVSFRAVYHPVLHPRDSITPQ